ncbi:tetratricopeptide repeat-containing sensor histidine kinase [Dokdonia pacifica]|uniref:histidine kinase n=1 Tax=Dokdonia pacifica TaxID=1627892 RepID=A0A238YZQ4_9FLAO|nr:tetratricopeptide repeat-containing sensor histidine kinase [Dokdonia pacifica]SNR76492.1 Histidine kinase-, DNA gyrase B-, and HSP90-like ATPase [Dokdonia pacifica]
MKYKILIFCILYFFPLLLFSQEKKEYSDFEKIIKQKSEPYTSELNFKKAQSFFLRREWDSTLLYTSKQLSLTSKNIQLDNFTHFLRGYSFYKKRVFNESKNEFLNISEDFDYYLHTKIFLGAIAIEQEDYTKALDYLLPIEEITNEELLGINRNSIEGNIGTSYMLLDRYHDAHNYIQKNLAYLEEKRDTIALVIAYGNLAINYDYLDSTGLAIKNYSKAYEFSRYIDDYDVKIGTTHNMYEIAKYLNQPEKAYQYIEEHNQWKDSLHDQNEVARVLQLEKRIAVEQKQQEVSLLEAENKVKEAQKDGLMYSSIILLLLLGTGVYFYREKVKTNKIISEQKENLDELNATKDKLFSIVSHDLRSSVNALKMSNSDLVDNLEAKNLEKVNTLLHSNSAIVNGAYNLLDNLLNWALLQTKQSFFEIAELRLFFIVEHVAHNYKALLSEKNIQFENTIPKKDKVFADQESLKIILRNIIDNAIKFSKPEDSIKIYTQHTHEGFCDLVIEDTGIGMSEATRQNLLQETIVTSEKENKDIIGSGLGMQLCKSMIKKNNGNFFIESTLGKGTKMIVSLSKIPPNG